MTEHQQLTVLPPPEGPEYTPCACGHIEPEHAPNNGTCLKCPCTVYLTQAGEPGDDPVRDIHEFALDANIRLSMRTGKATGPSQMWELATGTVAAWYAHRLLQRLAEVDPDGVAAFAEELAEEGEMPEMADNPVEVAQRMGFDAQAWIDAEYARRDATAPVEPTAALPIDHLRAIADSARHAITLTQAQNTADATEHVHAIERLITAYHIAARTQEA